MKTIKCNRPKKDIDDYWRIVIDVYYSPRPLWHIEKILEKATGIKWKFFGAFMDSACFATKSKPPKEFTIKIPWNE